MRDLSRACRCVAMDTRGANRSGQPDGVENHRLEHLMRDIDAAQDRAVDKDGLNRTWDRVAADYTLVIYPDVGHDVQLDAADRVTATMRWWLKSH
jgi:pimeloyl-ACP methyl ester carboxylesterase